MTAPSAFMAQDKSILETVYAGDIIGIHDPGLFSIGDTLSSGDIVNFMGIPDFPAEHFGRAILEDPLKSKKLAKGLEQLSEEGATQLFYPIEYPLPVLGVVGELQFDVIQSRLNGEYDVPIRFDKLGIFCARWVTGPQPIVQKFRSEHGRDIAKDKKGNLVYLCPNEYRLQLVQKNFPEIKLLAVMRAEGEL
jgi:peptide chain release factor 3